jgi:hypothetical protein
LLINSLIPASFPASSLHLHVVFPLFIVLPVAHTSVSEAYSSHPFLQHDQPTAALQFWLPRRAWTLWKGHEVPCT